MASWVLMKPCWTEPVEGLGLGESLEGGRGVETVLALVGNHGCGWEEGQCWLPFPCLEDHRQLVLR